jgi:UDP-2,3-diacylglucosamine hydrolase
MKADSVWPLVGVPTPLVAVADLHIDSAEAFGGSIFARWLAELGPIGTLVVLGDLFDVWVGPAQAQTPGAALVLEALRQVGARGARVYVVAGNRDFLLGSDFERRTGARVFPDGFTAVLPNAGRALFLHGDTLCTRDFAYQRLRSVLRSRPVRWIAPRLPLSVGLILARRLRRSSTRALARKAPERRAMQPEAAITAGQATNAQLVVCGHAHEAHQEVVAPRLSWIVLNAFGGPRDAFVVDTEGARLVDSVTLTGRLRSDPAQQRASGPR